MIISSRIGFRSLLLAATILASPMIALTSAPAAAQVAIGISVQTAPPLLPVYAQPPIPAVGYIWTPGYWGYAQADYYWVPGTWVQPPIAGVLWTPPYWGWSNGVYAFNQGYWGPHVGFYGGVNYGYGYGGSGYDGGHWNGGNFAYNRSANNFGAVSVQNTYEKTLIVNNRTNVSYVGGEHGLKAEPTAEERSAGTDRHTPATAEQTRHMTLAANDPAFAASHNNGHPAIAATSRPGEFNNAAGVRPLPGAAALHPERPAANEHTAEHAPGPAVAARPAEHAAEHVAVHPAVAHTVEHPVEHPGESAPVHPAVARPAEHPAAVHPAVERTAAPHAAPAHEEKPEERK